MSAEHTDRPTVPELCDAMWSLEQEFGLLFRKTSDVFPWPALRIKIYYELAYRLGIMQPDSGPQGRVKLALRAARSLLSRSAAGNTTGPAGLFVIASGRGGASGCPYTTPLLAAHIAAGGTAILLDAGRPPALANQPGLRLVQPESLDRQLLASYAKTKVSTFAQPALSPDERRFWSSVEDQLHQRLGTRLPLVDLIAEFIFFDRVAAPVYARMLERHMPAKLLLVCHYGRASWIRQARRLGIPVDEIQHGTMTKYHLGYSFPHWHDADGPVPYFPDRFLSWGSYWTTSTPLPLPATAIEHPGFETMRRQLRTGEAVGLPRNPRQILVLSQAALSGAFQAWTRALAEKHGNYRFVFKCHPAEDEAEVRATLAGLPNVEVEKTTDLHKLMTASRYVVGAFSTAVFEAIALGCKPVLLSLDGIEYMADLIERYAIPVLANAGELDVCIAAADKIDIPLRDVF